jgi:Kef-type K+ transport system membrane component KefB
MGAIGGAAMWFAAAAVLAAAVIGKFGGCTLAARHGGFGWRESACIGAMMNTRGLMELIVINVGYELGVLPKSVYCMLVIMAVATTVMTTPLLRWFMRGTELEPHILNSGIHTPRVPSKA